MEISLFTKNQWEEGQAGRWSRSNSILVLTCSGSLPPHLSFTTPLGWSPVATEKNPSDTGAEKHERAEGSEIGSKQQTCEFICLSASRFSQPPRAWHGYLSGNNILSCLSSICLPSTTAVSLPFIAPGSIELWGNKMFSLHFFTSHFTGVNSTSFSFLLPTEGKPCWVPKFRAYICGLKLTSLQCMSCIYSRVVKNQLPFGWLNFIDFPGPVGLTCPLFNISSFLTADWAPRGHEVALGLRNLEWPWQGSGEGLGRAQAGDVTTCWQLWAVVLQLHWGQ